MGQRPGDASRTIQDSRGATCRLGENGVMVFAHGDPQSKALPRGSKGGTCRFPYRWNQDVAAARVYRHKSLVSREVRKAPVKIGRILTFSRHFSRGRWGNL